MSAFDKIQGTVRKKYQSIREVVKDNMLGSVEEEEMDQEFMRNLQAKTLEQRSKERMQKRLEKLDSDANEEIMRRTVSKGRYLSMKQPKIVKYDSQVILYPV